MDNGQWTSEQQRNGAERSFITEHWAFYLNEGNEIYCVSVSKKQFDEPILHVHRALKQFCIVIWTLCKLPYNSSIMFTIAETSSHFNLFSVFSFVFSIPVNCCWCVMLHFFFLCFDLTFFFFCEFQENNIIREIMDKCMHLNSKKQTKKKTIFMQY